MGLGAPHGVEIVGHLFRALYEQQFAVCTTDFTNGFNAFARQAMLDAVNARCPALNNLFTLFYGQDSPCFYQLDGIFHVIMSCQGSRMGCVLGSLGFDLTVQDVYERVLCKLSDAVTKALTDDYTAGIALQP